MALCRITQRGRTHVRGQDYLNKAIEIYKECGANSWLKKAEEALTKM